MHIGNFDRSGGPEEKRQKIAGSDERLSSHRGLRREKEKDLLNISQD